MSFDLAVWEGERPASDAAALREYERRMDALETADPEPPTPRITAFVHALLERWPDIDVDESSPWAGSPLIADASGSTFYTGVAWSRADEAAEFIAATAREHGLVCFDPQSERLL
ncbi:MAG: hypothetical protein AB7O74_07290 [Candidatus Nanopelagicales bacterium]